MEKDVPKKKVIIRGSCYLLGLQDNESQDMSSSLSEGLGLEKLDLGADRFDWLCQGDRRSSAVAKAIGLPQQALK